MVEIAGSVRPAEQFGKSFSSILSTEVTVHGVSCFSGAIDLGKRATWTISDPQHSLGFQKCFLVEFLSSLSIMGVQLVSTDEIDKSEVSTDDTETEKTEVQEVNKLKGQVQDLMWMVNVLRARSKKEHNKKRMLIKKNENLEKRICMYESYRKRYQLQEKALADLREEAKELREKHEVDKELLKEMNEALGFRLKEGALEASDLVKIYEAEEPRGSHRRTRSLPPRPEQEEEAGNLAQAANDVIENFVVPQPRGENEEYEQWAKATIMRMHERAIHVDRLVKDLREGSAEAVRLRSHGIAGY
eukprot:s50_g63.t1